MRATRIPTVSKVELFKPATHSIHSLINGEP
jgi:hypothetical protein